MKRNLANRVASEKSIKKPRNSKGKILVTKLLCTLFYCLGTLHLLEEVGYELHATDVYPPQDCAIREGEHGHKGLEHDAAKQP